MAASLANADLDICAHTPKQTFGLFVQVDGHSIDHIAAEFGGDAGNISDLAFEFFAEGFDENRRRLPNLDAGDIALAQVGGLDAILRQITDGDDDLPR